MRVAVVTFPGSNCDQDCHRSVEAAGGEPVPVWHRERSLAGADAVILPGGFAHGDYLRPGAIARFSPILEPVVEYARAGGFVVGICNGFQILCEAGLLPGALLRNLSLRFQSHDCALRVERADTPFTSRYREGQVIRIPLAHADGNYYAGPRTLDKLESRRRVVFRYSDPNGGAAEDANPNGSLNRIAGIVNAGGNVLGLMPHPDRAIESATGSADGLPLFASLVASARQRTSPTPAATGGEALAEAAR